MLTSLKIVREIGVWFHRSYEGRLTFKPGSFVPPVPPTDVSKALADELAQLKRAIAASADSEAKAVIAAQDAEQRQRISEDRAEQDAREKVFWENYEAETEAALRSAEAALSGMQAQAAAIPQQQLDMLANLAADSAKRVELDERTTRVLIDDRLRAAGWTVDSVNLRHALGTRPDYVTPIAIAAWPTKSGPVDYALFIERRCAGVIEAKRRSSDVPGRIGQAKRYARDIALTPDELPPPPPAVPGSKTRTAFEYRLCSPPMAEPMVKQLATKSGT